MTRKFIFLNRYFYQNPFRDQPAPVGPCLRDVLEKAQIIFQQIVKPVVLRLEADEDAGRSAMARDDDFLFLGFPQIPGQVVLDFGERGFALLGFAELRQPFCSLRFGHDRQNFNGLFRHVVAYPNLTDS